MTFYELITSAVRDITEHGYDTEERLDYWMECIQDGLENSLEPPERLDQMLRENLRAIYDRLVEKGTVLQRHPGVDIFTIKHIKPELREELNRRILASANLIKLNRQEMVRKTLQRFSGWATSVPAGGSITIQRAPVKANIRKSLLSLPYEERRVLIDQGHKLASSISAIVANDSGAIAAVWHSHWRQKNYNYREDHKERDEHTYVVRNNWAITRGLMKVGPDGYTDQITQPAEEPFCRCYYKWVYHLSSLPRDLLTEKGVTELARVRIEAQKITGRLL